MMRLHSFIYLFDQPPPHSTLRFPACLAAAVSDGAADVGGKCVTGSRHMDQTISTLTGHSVF